jgi:hypothetical protein
MHVVAEMATAEFVQWGCGGVAPPYRFAAQHDCDQASLPIGWPRLLNSRELSAMPTARYFMVVGSALVVLLLIAGWSLPELPPSFHDRPEVIQRAAIRIKSAHKWPEKVVLNTSQPTIAPPAVEEPRAARSGWLPPDEPEDQSNLEAMAQLRIAWTAGRCRSSNLANQARNGTTARSRRVARGPVTHRLARAEMGGGCCQFGWIDNGQTSSNAMSHRHAASSWPMDRPVLMERN